MAIIKKTEEFIKQKLANDSSGHDWWHISQVRKNALEIAATEECDLEIVELAALLHDIADSKFHNGDHSVGGKLASAFLTEQGLDQDKVDHIAQIIRDQSFSANSGILPTIEGRIVQDADRLEALGAIGIARCFAYGGKKGRPIYNPDDPEKQYSIQHFYDKLLKLKELMNTNKGKQLAEQRNEFMEQFLNQFFNEVK